MVLEIKTPKAMCLILWTEKRAHKIFRAKEFIPLKRYLSAELVSSLLHLDELSTFNKAAASKTFHVVMYNGKALYHPKGAWKEIVKPFKEFVRRELKRDRLTRSTPAIIDKI